MQTCGHADRQKGRQTDKVIQVYESVPTDTFKIPPKKCSHGQKEKWSVKMYQTDRQARLSLIT